MYSASREAGKRTQPAPAYDPSKASPPWLEDSGHDVIAERPDGLVSDEAAPYLAALPVP